MHFKIYMPERIPIACGRGSLQLRAHPALSGVPSSLPTPEGSSGQGLGWDEAVLSGTGARHTVAPPPRWAGLVLDDPCWPRHRCWRRGCLRRCCWLPLQNLDAEAVMGRALQLGTVGIGAVLQPDAAATRME